MKIGFELILKSMSKMFIAIFCCTFIVTICSVLKSKKNIEFYGNYTSLLGKYNFKLKEVPLITKQMELSKTKELDDIRNYKLRIGKNYLDQLVGDFKLYRTRDPTLLMGRFIENKALKENPYKFKTNNFVYAANTKTDVNGDTYSTIVEKKKINNITISKDNITTKIGSLKYVNKYSKEVENNTLDINVENKLRIENENFIIKNLYRISSSNRENKFENSKLIYMKNLGIDNEYKIKMPFEFKNERYKIDKIDYLDRYKKSSKMFYNNHNIIKYFQFDWNSRAGPLIII